MSVFELSTSLADAAQAAGQSLVRIGGDECRGVTGVAFAEGLVVSSNEALAADDEHQASFEDETFELELVGADEGTDIALLRYDPKSLKRAPVVPTWRSHEDIRVGELALAVARPGKTVRAALGALGVVAGSYRGPTGSSIEALIEVDRPLPRGFATNLVCDVRGQAIGLTTSGLLRHMSLTLPAVTLSRVVASLQTHGRVQRGFLGVGVYPVQLPERQAKKVGRRETVTVVGLEDRGPAALSGIQVGDVIISIGGDPIRTPLELRGILSDRGGQTLQVRVLRGEQPQLFEVNLGNNS